MRYSGYTGGYDGVPRNPYYWGFTGNYTGDLLETKYLWWDFVEDPSGNLTPTPGYWNLGDYIGDISAIQGAKSYTACPHDNMNEWGHSVQLKCGEAPQQPQPTYSTDRTFNKKLINDSI